MYRTQGNRNAVQDHGYYGDSTILSPSSHDNGVGRSVSAMDTLSHENGFQGWDELSRQDKLPWQNASQLDQQNRNDGSGEVFPPINSKFNDFGGRKGDNTVHVQGINSQWKTISQHIQRPIPNSGEENSNNTAPLEHYTFPVEKKHKKKKGLRKKHH
ncbi:hypothetical protein RhiirA4_418895 [Rhizophagus irregularis]|uniref:Uncharacterized protein n=1 Tax=Rhizophagus irregularis TaxID=588596 RepID=A0A2I1GCB4_9GLOM|nr:hypothetical protein RhiirA4_418895 [Rhizophagus irregularis]